MRLITRNDATLSVALIAATIIVFRQPLHYVLTFTQEIEERFHLDLVPALMLLVVAFTFHEYRKRMQVRAEALAAAADAAQARAQARTLQQLMALGKALADALEPTALQQVLWKHLPAFARDRKIWMLVRTVDHWDILLQDTREAPRSLEDLEQLATQTLANETASKPTDTTAAADACFPMLAAGSVIGVLGVSGASPLPDEQRRLLEAAAAVIAIGVRNMQLFQSARELSLRDALTGCFNRGHALETLDAELRRIQRSGRPLSILMFDVDHFKAVNDQFGHLRGDALLHAIGERLGAILRGTDVRCRYGGDEFLIILPETPTVGAQQVAEGLREDFAALTTADGRRAPVTISIGIATATPEDLHPEAFITRADTALYRAKREGRNRVCVACQQSPPEAPAATVRDDDHRSQIRIVASSTSRR